MSIHNQFTFIYFIVFIVILLAVNLLIIKFQKRDWREFFNWKSILLALAGLVLGFYWQHFSCLIWIRFRYKQPGLFYVASR